MSLKIVAHAVEEGGFWAEVVPARPACVSHGEPMDELLANMREAIQAWLDTAPPDDVQPAARRQTKTSLVRSCGPVVGEFECGC